MHLEARRPRIRRARVRFSTASATGSSPGWHLLQVVAESSCRSSARRASGRPSRRAGKVPTLRPSRSTVTRSATSSTSFRRCETNMMEMPFAFSSPTRDSSASTSWRVSEEVGSSMMTRRASAAMARQMATSWRLATERSATLASRSSETPIRAIAWRAVRLHLAPVDEADARRDGCRRRCSPRRSGSGRATGPGR